MYSTSDSGLITELPRGGFNFENYQRNESFVKRGYPQPKVQKTGTTIAGIVFKDGVILGADTRATSDTIVADKNCSKIHFLAKNIYCCGAGTAADTEFTTKMIASQLELHRLNSAAQVPVCVANRLLKQYLYRYQGHIGAALVLGGSDKYGAHLYCIHPHGSTNKLPYVTMGSGSLAAMAVFEQGWKPDMGVEEGKKLVRDAIAAGIFNDLGSGSNVDLCVITKTDTQYLRTYEEANLKGVRQGEYKIKPGTTEILSSKTIPVVLETQDIFIRSLDDGPILRQEEQMDTA